MSVGGPAGRNRNQSKIVAMVRPTMVPPPRACCIYPSNSLSWRGRFDWLVFLSDGGASDCAMISRGLSGCSCGYIITSFWNRRAFGSRLLWFLIARQLHYFKEHSQHIEPDESYRPAEPDRNGWKGYRCNRDVGNALSRSTIHCDL